MNKNNIKLYFLWIFGNTLYLTEFTFYINRYGYGIISSICLGIMFQFAYYIIFSWTESLVRLISWKMKKYNLLIVRLFPICIEFSSERMHICFDKGIFEFGNIYVFPQITLENFEKMNVDSVEIANICKKTNLIWFVVTFIIACITNFYVTIFIMTLGSVTYLFLHIESDIVFTGGRYSAMKKEKIVCENYYSIVLNNLDVCSKERIYRKFCKEMVTYDEQTIRERKAMEGVIIDSICDGYDYVSEECNDILIAIFEKKDLKQQAVYNRLFFIYRIYCKIFHLDKEQQVNERFDEYLDELLRVNPGFFNKKIVKLLYGDYREIMDYRNNSYLYEKKIERIKKIGEKER